MRASVQHAAATFASLVAAAAVGCRGQAGAQAESTLESPQVPVTTVLTEQYGGLDEPRRVVIRNAAEWAAFWTGRPAPPLPAVDFERDMLVAVGIGMRPTGGHELTVESARRVAGRLVVTVREVAPGAGCMVTQALTSPVVAARLPRSAEQVEFVVLRERRDCAP